MDTPLLPTLLRQHNTAWKLASYHLKGLTTAECLWQPAPTCLHVRRGTDGSWRPDWPESEGYQIGPASIAWLTWHLGYWLKMVLDHSFGNARLEREQITWPGEAWSAVAWIESLQAEWTTQVGTLSEADLLSSERTRWPYTGRPFADVLAWSTVELTKNAAEIGYARFLYAVRPNA